MRQNRKVRMWSMAAATTWALSASAATAQLALVPGDVNGDGIVNALDLALVASNWGNGYGPGDANGDGIVNGQDIALIASNWLKTGPTFQQVVDSLPPPPASAYTNGVNAANLQQIGLTQAVAAAGNYGEGVTIGIVDIYLLPGDPTMTPRVSPLSICPYCPDNSDHGTVVTDVAAGDNPLAIGIAPKAAVAFMSPDGSPGLGWDPLIRAAANAGSEVINLSIMAALNNIAAINYAASKGATVVIAAGNNGWPYFDTPALPGSGGVYITQSGEYGFTPQALSHIIVVGAVNPANVAESWSDIPGPDFIGTTGTQNWAWVNPDGTLTPFTPAQLSCWQTGNCPNGALAANQPVVSINNSTGPIATLQSLWLMAPGEIPDEGSGTSFAAPYVTGAVALLDSRWPILFKNGTTAQVLFETATNLGDPSIYGNGELNLTAAFQPIGGLSVVTNSGNVSVNQVVASLQASGPLGGMQALQAGLSNYTVFDSFSRDFKENLAYLISYKPSMQSLAQTAIAPQPKVSSTSFADGSALSFGKQDAMDNGVDKPMGHAADENWMISFTDANGSMISAGQGFPASASFAQSMWGANTAAATQSSSLGVANALASLAEGGPFTSAGTNIGKDMHLPSVGRRPRLPIPCRATTGSNPPPTP